MVIRPTVTLCTYWYCSEVRHNPHRSHGCFLTFAWSKVVNLAFEIGNLGSRRRLAVSDIRYAGRPILGC